MLRLIVLSLVNVIRNPLRRAALYPWLILTVEQWARQVFHVTLPTIGATGVVGTFFAVAGICLSVAALVQFIRQGHGTPEPFVEPTKLITSGVFRWSRNPMYVGLLTILVGEVLFFMSLPL